MPNLHPDKLVGVARAVQQRPRRPKPSVERTAMAAASQPKPLSPKAQPKAQDDGLMANLAYRIRDEHWNGFLDRMGRGGVAELGKAQTKPASPKPKQPQSIVISFGPPNA